MGIEIFEKLGSKIKDSSLLSGSLIPKWLHENVMGIWGRLTHAFDKVSKQRDGGMFRKIGAFVTGLFEDYKGLTQESVKAREETAGKATDIISQSASPEAVQKSLEAYAFEGEELSPEEKGASDVVLGVLSKTWLSSPEKYDVTVVADSFVSGNPDVNPEDITLEQKLSTVKFGLQYARDLQKYCRENNVSADDLAKKIDKLDGLKRFKFSFQDLLSIDAATAANSPLKMIKLSRIASQVPFDKLQSGRLEKVDVYPLFPNTSSKEETMEATVRVINSAMRGKSAPSIEMAKFILGVHERDLENLMQLVS